MIYDAIILLNFLFKLNGAFKLSVVYHSRNNQNLMQVLAEHKNLNVQINFSLYWTHLNMSIYSLDMYFFKSFYKLLKLLL